PSVHRVRCAIGAPLCPAVSKLTALMARRPIASPSAPIYGRGLILFFPGSILDRILAALAGTRARSLPQNKLRCSDYAVSLLAPLSLLPRKHLSSANWSHTSRKCLSFFSRRKSCAW